MRILSISLAWPSARADPTLARDVKKWWMTRAKGVEGVSVIVGMGIDVADVARYRFDRAKLAWFARKVYTEDEMSYALRKRNWHERLAGFFAAKEATRKAFGHAIPWRSVGVTHERSGKPTIELRDAAHGLLRARGVRSIHLSITHTPATAAAFVILES
jgi:holo-[acyl-carrier protein] synthase